jgi:TonB family protein
MRLGKLSSVLWLTPLVALATITPAQRAGPATPEYQGHRLITAVTRASQFVDVVHVSSRPTCQQVQPPGALETPSPLFRPATRDEKVIVSFIVGTDGRVHSPLILQSAGLAGDRRVLQTVRTWKYRPATCNGIPTEIEGKVEFSIR